MTTTTSTTEEVFAQLLDNPTYTRKIVPLSDGRQLSYSEAGDLDSGTPLLFCEGLMVSSLVALTFHQEALARHLRVIAVDYPGIGDSTPVPNRTLQDWPLDLLEFCNAVLGPDTQFHLACHSMGGPHALAVLASKSTRARILSATLVSPWLPFDNKAEEAGSTSTEQQQAKPQNTNKWFLSAARHMPNFVSQTVIPKIVTGAASTSLAMVGSMPASSAPSNLVMAKHITDYAAKQGQAGNQQMVQLALSSSVPLPDNLDDDDNHPFAVRVFCGTKDHLVSEAACQLLVDKWNRLIESHGGQAEPMASLQMIEGADHNTIMSEEHQPLIFATFVSKQ